MKDLLSKFTTIDKIFSILVYTILFSPALSGYAQSISPDQQTLKFYQWYVTTWMSRPEESNLIENPQIQSYITQGLYRKITTSIKNNTFDRLSQGADYFTHTQDFDISWLSYFHASTVKISPTDATVSLHMDIPKENGGINTVCLHLKNTDGAWKINSVDPIGLIPPVAGCPTSTH